LRNENEGDSMNNPLKIYVDFDGVILDTWDIIYPEYCRVCQQTEIDDRLIDVMLSIGWKKILEESKVIKNNIQKVKDLAKDYDVCVLSKINSSEEEQEKEKFLKKNGIQKMCFVPYAHSKANYVDPTHAILIDDTIENLDEWDGKGGISIYFQQKSKDSDNFDIKNSKYLTINDLLEIYDMIKEGEFDGNRN